MIEYPESYREAAKETWSQMRLDLKVARLEAGLTQLDVASAIGVSLANFNAWERDKWAPATRFMLAWASVVGLRVELKAKGRASR